MNLPYRQPAKLASPALAFDFSRGGLPILIGTDVDLSEGATDAAPTDDRYVEAFRRPILVDEIRFIARSPDILSILGGPGAGENDYNFGGSLRCKFRVGGIELSREFIPVSMYGPDINQDPTSSFISGSDAAYSYAHFRWILPQPLLVRQNGGLQVRFSRGRDGFGGTARVSVSVVGRIVEQPLPAKIKAPIPHVGFFATEPSDGNGSLTGIGFSVSDENAFSNPYDVPLNVQRFILREEINGYLTSPLGLKINLVTAEGYVSLTDPDNRAIIPDLAAANPLNTPERLFGPNRMLPIHRTMAPGIARIGATRTRKQHYRAKFYNYLFGNEIQTIFMSMVGWREEML